VITLLTWVNCRGLRQGAMVQNVFTVAKVGGVITLVAIGFIVPSNPSAVQRNFGDFWPAGINLGLIAVLGGALVGSLFSADAWNNVTFTGSEVVNPKRNLPLSLFLGTATVTILYFVANLMYLRILPLESIMSAPEDRVGTLAAQAVMGSWGQTFINIAILISTFGCTNGLVLAGARVYYAMSKDGLFFKRAGVVSSKTHTPVFSLIIQAIWASLLALSGTYSDLLNYVIFAGLLFYALTVIALFILRKKRPDLERPYKVVGYPVLPALYVVLSILVALDLLWVKPAFTWPGLIIVLTGVPVYFLWHAKKKNDGISDAAN